MKVVTQVMVMIGLMLVGYVMKHRNLIHKESKKDISDILLYIALPSATISAFNQPVSDDLVQKGIVVLLFGLIAHMVAMLISKVLYAKQANGPKEVMSYVTVFSNCAFMGFPVMQSLFGEQGIFYASLYLLSFNLFIWTYGQILFTKKMDRRAVKKALFNTGTLSVVVGATLLISPVKMPETISTIFSMLGSITTPLAMIVIGATLAECDFRTLLRGYQMYAATFVRLVGIPLLWIAVLKLLQMDDLLIAVCAMLVAMPAASNTAMFAEKFDSDTILASKTVVFSTIISMITIPVIALICV